MSALSAMDRDWRREWRRTRGWLLPRVPVLLTLVLLSTPAWLIAGA